jgi:diketogulonate reductase-like aldo/keto reductase
MSTRYTITDRLHMPKCAAQVPRLGFGVHQSSTEQGVASCTTALTCGYRHIDTAQFYGNEADVGAVVSAAVRQSGLKRADIFITTKILSSGGNFAKSLQKCLDGVAKIDGSEGYVDCLLIHSPSGAKDKHKEMWQALEKLYEMGQAKSIGVSNFGVGQIEEMKAYASVWPPHVNQIEVSSGPVDSPF